MKHFDTIQYFHFHAHIPMVILSNIYCVLNHSPRRSFFNEGVLNVAFSLGNFALGAPGEAVEIGRGRSGYQGDEVTCHTVS